MKTKTTNSGIKVKANVKAGGMAPWQSNHARLGLKVRAGIKVGTGSMIASRNHNARPLQVS